MLRRSALAAAVVFGSVGLLVVAPQAPVVRAQDEGGALAKFREGLAKYKKGDYRGAIEDFDKVLADNPTVEEARQLRDEIEEEMVLDFINSNLADAGLAGRYSRFGKWLLAGRQVGLFPSRENDQELIESTVTDYMSDGNRVRRLERAMQIRDRFGDYAVPFIQKNYMHSESESDRYGARVLLATIGAQGVNALIQCMLSDEMYDRQTAALAMGDIADPRALPVLSQHYQDASEDARVREACRAGIEAVRAAMPEKDLRVDKAKDLWFLQAESYYRNNAAGGYYRNRLVGANYGGHLPVLVLGADGVYHRTYTVWKWSNGEDGFGLHDQEVPLWAFADIMAEESALRALEMGIAGSTNAEKDAFVQDGEALMACIHMHMYTEGVARYYAGNDWERGQIVKLLGEYGMSPFLGSFGMAALHGTPRLYLALERSLADGYPEVSVAICDALAEADAREVIGTNGAAPLARALEDSDKRVRYAAARAFVRLGRARDTGKNTMVENTVVRNLQESAAWSVLVISEDEALRNRLLSDLTENSINASGARTLEDGARMATQAPVYDAIIIEGSIALAPTFYWEPSDDAFKRGENSRMETIFQILKSDVRTAHIPILVGIRDDMDVEGRKETLMAVQSPEGDQVLEEDNFFTYSREYQTDSSAIVELLKNQWDENIEASAKGRSNRLVTDMAGALAVLDPAASKFQIKTLLEGLAGGLIVDGRTSEAREAICLAIGVLVADGKKLDAPWLHQNIVPNLLDTINSEDEVNTPKVAAAAAWALGQVYAWHSKAFDESAYDALSNMLRRQFDLAEIQDDDRREDMIRDLTKARNAAGVALGRSPLTAAQRLEVARLQATNPHWVPERRPATEEDE